jgi:hypothetical protein
MSERRVGPVLRHGAWSGARFSPASCCRATSSGEARVRPTVRVHKDRVPHARGRGRPEVERNVIRATVTVLTKAEAVSRSLSAGISARVRPTSEHPQPGRLLGLRGCVAGAPRWREGASRSAACIWFDNVVALAELARTQLSVGRQYPSWIKDGARRRAGPACRGPRARRDGPSPGRSSRLGSRNVMRSRRRLAAPHPARSAAPAAGPTRRDRAYPRSAQTRRTPSRGRNSRKSPFVHEGGLPIPESNPPITRKITHLLSWWVAKNGFRFPI